MLRPDETSLFTDAIRPPQGFELDSAVGTTYTLDLVALMMTQLAFASHDVNDGVNNVSPLALLDAVQRNAHKTKLFVHGGAIAVPKKWRGLLTLLEDSIAEVNLEEGIFHPKMWALRYVSDKQTHHRVLVSSRNLTFDNSWDTILVLDQHEPKIYSEKIGGEDIADFLLQLPTMSSGAAQDHVADLANSVRGTEFALPGEFTRATIRTTGSPGALQRRFRGRRGLLISPFLSQSMVDEFTKNVDETIILSRADSLDALGERLDNQRLFTLKPQVDEEGTEKEENLSTEAPGDPAPHLDLASGLHAKLFITQDGRNTRILTGSMNATSAAFERNVEFGVELSAQLSRLKISDIWGEDNHPQDGMGLSDLCTPYEPQKVDSDQQRREELQWQLAHHHHRLAGARISARVSADSDETYSKTVTIEGLEDLQGNGIKTTIRPLTINNPQKLQDELTWRGVSLRSITPYLAVNSEIRSEGIVESSSCVLLANLSGAPSARDDLVIKDILSSNDLAAYLLLLLTNPKKTLDAAVQDTLDVALGGDNRNVKQTIEPMLFEPLVLAATGDSQELDRFAHMIDEIKRLGEADRLPAGILDLWDALEPLVESSKS